MKIGIVTLFYNSTNYGGILQSYALAQKLNQADGVLAEQISYKKDFSVRSAARWKKIFHLTKVYRHIRAKVQQILQRKVRERVAKISEMRVQPFSHFVTEYIPKTKEIYSQNTISDLLNHFDIFITGSDQVWNTSYYDEVYRLDFVPNNKFKMSYAAGISSGKLTREQIDIFRSSLQTYDAISVREKSTINALQGITDTQIQWVLDPTLLLSCSDWDNICSERKISEEYVFCYFLGKLSIENKKIIEFAQKRNLKIVSMPYLAGTSRKDSDFGDYKIYDADPRDFLSFIKYASYVFTDSFHATVFSHIYQRDFFAFERKELKGMNDRIESLTYLFDTQNRFCDTREKATLRYIESLPPIDYSKPFPKFEEMKEKSINFLKENLKKAEEKTHGNQ